jgi:ADP-dependent glucokinase
MALGTLKIFLGLLAALVAVIVYRRQAETNRLTAVLAGLLQAESSASLDSRLRVAVGFGSCVDVIGPALEILSRVGAVPPAETEHYDSVHNMEELQRMFTYYFQHGAAAEYEHLISF